MIARKTTLSGPLCRLVAHRGYIALAICVSVVASGLSWAGVSNAASAARIDVSLQPAAGQYFPVPAVTAMDTRDGVGGVAARPLGPHGTVIVPVIGLGDVPGTGVSDVFVAITAISPTKPGALEDYNTDNSNPAIFTVPFAAGQQVTASDLVQVSQSGDISVTNASSGSTNVQVAVLGYVQSQYVKVAGDRYAPVEYHEVLNTRYGLGAPKAEITAGGRVTVQITGQDGVPADSAGTALYIGAEGGSAAGWISAFPAGERDPAIPVASYSRGATASNLYFGKLSRTGEITLVNHGSAPVNLTAAVQGYLVRPSAAESGATWNDVSPRRIADTRFGTGHALATPLAAGKSLTFTVARRDGVPANGVPTVIESVAVSHPMASGYLSVQAADDMRGPGPTVAFAAGDAEDAAMLAAVLSRSGRETITNHSSGPVNVIAAIRGYYTAATVPNPPDSVYDDPTSKTTATISWEPPYGDGGSPITSYTVSAPPDRNTVTVGPHTLHATLTGLTNSKADDFTVRATNAVGRSAGADDEYMTSNPDSQEVEQDIGVSINPATGTETLVDSRANLVTGTASGQARITRLTPDTADLHNDRAAAAMIPHAEIGCSVHIKRSKGAKVHQLPSFDNTFENSVWAFAWKNNVWAVNKANVDPRNRKPEWQAIVCTSGSGNTSPGSGYKAALSENALLGNSTHEINLQDGEYGTKVTSSSTVTSMLGFSFGGQYQGASISVMGSESVSSTVINSELNGFVGGTDFHFGLAYPPDLLRYNPVRVNTEWEAHNAAGRTDTAVGNVAQARYFWDQTRDNDHTFYSVVIFYTCRKGLCGYAYANSTSVNS